MKTFLSPATVCPRSRYPLPVSPRQDLLVLVCANPLHPYIYRYLLFSRPPGSFLRQRSAELPLIEREFCDGGRVAVDGEPAEERKPRVRGDSGVRQRRVE